MVPFIRRIGGESTHDEMPKIPLRPRQPLPDRFYRHNIVEPRLFAQLSSSRIGRRLAAVKVAFYHLDPLGRMPKYEDLLPITMLPKNERDCFFFRHSVFLRYVSPLFKELERCRI